MPAIPKPTRIRSESRLAWCRRQPCILAGIGFHSCSGRADAHHVIAKGVGGSDFTTLPLCRYGHRIYHDSGRIDFEAFYGVNLDRLIREHNARYRKEHPPKAKAKRVRVKADRYFVLHSECGKSHRIKGGVFFCRGKVKAVGT